MSVWCKAMRCRRREWLGMVMVLALVSCAQYSVGYLDEAVGRATQAEVAQNFGQPHAVMPLDDGGSVWAYYDRGSAVSGYGGYRSGTSYCRAYVLTFDQQKILRAWKEQDCRN